MILKTTFPDGQVVFEDLSDKFIITSKQRTPAKFDEIAKGYTKGFSQDLKELYAFVSSLRMEREDIPLFTDFHYAILSERGCEVMRVGIGDL